jgi:cullin 3
MANLPQNKFLVDRGRMRDANMQRSQAQQHWATIQDAINKIYNKQASSLSYEELYRTAYSLVLHKHGQMLYESVKDTTVQLLKPIAENIR